MKLFFKLWILFFFSAAAVAQTGTGKVVGVKDGDTVVILGPNNTQVTIRLAEVDCPEKSQAFGKNAKQFTSEAVYLKNVTYKIETIDRYGRTVAQVFYDNGKYLSEELIKYGYGWHYKKYSTSQSLAKLETQAQKRKLGLWVDTNAIAPWSWRKM
jgi:micrococcal nuclease